MLATLSEPRIFFNVVLESTAATPRESSAVVAGGAAIADKIEAVKGDVFAARPVLRPWDWARIVARAALGGLR